jgi:hypothetical protein
VSGVFAVKQFCMLGEVGGVNKKGLSLNWPLFELEMNLQEIVMQFSLSL